MSRRRGGGKQTALDKAVSEAGGVRIGEAARRLGVGDEVVTRYLRAGQIRSVEAKNGEASYLAVDESSLVELEAKLLRRKS